MNNLIQVTQGNQTPRTFSYSSLGRLLSASNPESGVINYEYDDNGNLKKKIDPRFVPDTSTKRTTTYEYDALGRVTSRVYNDGTPNVSYGYDAVVFSQGQLTSVTSSVSSYTYDEFDPLGRVKTATQTTDGQPYTMHYSYNRAGALTSQEYPSGRIVDTNYDAAGRMAGVKNNATNSYYAGAALDDETNRLQYSAHGAIQAMKLGNGLWERANFNSRLQLIQIGLTTNTNSNLLQLDYNYGTTANNGNLLTQTITIPGLTFTQTYTYDELNRLRTAKENNGDSWKQKFDYDRYGNRRIDPNPLETSAELIGPNPEFAAANNRIVPQAGELYDYDSAGNLTRDRDGQTYLYDAENKMVGFNGGVSQGGAEYHYDGAGQRVKKIVGTVTTIFVYDLFGKLIAEYGSAPPVPNGTRYLTSDHLGSPRVVTDSSALVKARHDYHPFGEEIVIGEDRNTNPDYVADGLRQKFTAKERDTETNLDYSINRYYSPKQGRFTSADEPFMDQAEGDPQSWNLYSYVRNNPLKYIDPSGKARWVVGPDGQQHYVGDVVGEYNKDLNATWNGQVWVCNCDNSPLEVTPTFWDRMLGALHLLGRGRIEAVAQEHDARVALAQEINRALNDPGVQFALNTIAIGQIASKLTAAATTPGRAGVTPAGRAFQKHLARGGVFVGPKTGNATINAQQGAQYIDDILAHPNAQVYIRPHPVHGDVLDVRIPGGPGARWTADGSRFIGFLEP